MAELGLLGVFVPEKYGGAGLDTVCYAITIEELSRGDASAGVIAAVCNGLVCEPLLHYGTEEQKRKFLEPVARGEWLDRKSTRLNSSHRTISYAVFCLKKKI